MNAYSLEMDAGAGFGGNYAIPIDPVPNPGWRPARMTRSLAKSNAQFQKAIRKLPLGVSSNFRYWGEDKTIYVKSGKGARLTDIDGNEYIDYRLAYGPCILGYADPLGNRAQNQTLSDNRAKTVLKYLNEKGIKAADQTAVGKGSADRFRRQPVIDLAEQPPADDFERLLGGDGFPQRLNAAEVMRQRFQRLHAALAAGFLL